ncbi:exonuclease SbcCD subunit D [Bacillaceae bacterium S4-13-58]
MKFFHTADWHLGKLVQGVYMTEEQAFILQQFLKEIENEKPDCVVIAGDLYDRAVPPTEAINLLNEILEKIVLDLKTPVIAIAGNHDSPGRLHFGSKIMKTSGFHIIGELSLPIEPVVLEDNHGEVHFHLVPYTEPSIIRKLLNNEEIKTHNDALEALVVHIEEKKVQSARHVFVGHLFATPNGEAKENTSTSERPLSIGGAEYVSHHHFKGFHYTALGHLHQAHYVGDERVRYAGSLLKYSVSEEKHKKGYYAVEIDESGNTTVEKRLLTANRDLYTVEGFIEDIEKHARCEDFVFVRLLNDTPVLSAMERVRSVYPNAMHIERSLRTSTSNMDFQQTMDRTKLDDLSLFKAFYKEIKGTEVSKEVEGLFKETIQELLQAEGERR